MPPLSEQRAIAHTLGTLDDKIELNLRMNETHEALARAIFKSWFVDFDPVRAKMEGHQRAGMDAATAALFPAGFEDSALGKIPKGWKVAAIGNMVTLDKGVSYKGAFLAEDGVPMINLGCFQGGGKFSMGSLKFYRGDFQDRHVVVSGDIVMANTDITQKREVLGSPAIVPVSSHYKKFIFTHHVFTLRLVDPLSEWKEFLFFMLLQPEFRERAAGFATGTTVLALPRDAVLNYSFAAPKDEKLIAAFRNLVKPMLERASKNMEESMTLAALRDTLLPKLLSGEVQVKDMEMNL
jgi:type I restriction enzyme, S subunit